MKIRPHNTEEVIIKSTHVDKGIKNLVMWLNGFSSVETIFSCQGFSKEEQNIINASRDSDGLKELHSSYPYVLFTCGDKKQLIIILDCVQKFIKTSFAGDEKGFVKFDISYNIFDERIEYNLIMENTEYPDSIVKYYNSVYKWQLESKMKQIP